MLPTISTTQDILRVARADDNSHFFDADTMRFFGSRLTKTIRVVTPHSGFFITSEKDPFGVFRDGGRTFTVRSYVVRPDGHIRINTVPEGYSIPGYHTAAKIMRGLDADAIA